MSLISPGSFKEFKTVELIQNYCKSNIQDAKVDMLKICNVWNCLQNTISYTLIIVEPKYWYTNNLDQIE